MYFDSFGNTGILFTFVPILVMAIFVVVLVIIIYRLVQSAQQWKKNNDSPVLTVEAKVTGKRTDVSHYHHANMSNNTMDMGYSSTYYYVTFEVSSGDRIEFHVADTEYGLLSEGDKGSLTFKGTRYLSFERDTRI